MARRDGSSRGQGEVLSGGLDSTQAHEEAADRLAASPDATRDARDATRGMLGLLRAAGNRATAALIARAPEAAIQLQAAENAGGLTLQRAMRAQAPQAGGILNREDDVTRTSISETTDTGNKYTQDLVLNKTQARISITLGVNWVKAGTWASDDAFNAFIRKVKTTAYGYLDNKFKVVCTPTSPDAGPAAVELPIDFIIYDNDSGYTITAHGGPPGGDSAMAQAGGNVYEYDGSSTLELGITYAHEFGHAILGASDEYANPAVPGRVLTNDHSIMANYYAQGKTQAEFKARHFQHIVTEVAKAFAGYTCGLRQM
jgi:hypothetical protein